MQHRSSAELGIILQQGTRALGPAIGLGGKIGTVTFPSRFPGTPQVSLSVMAGSSSVNRANALRVTRAVSGSFQFVSGGSAGTFAWSALMPLARWPSRSA